MNLSTQLENNEARCKSASVCQLLGVMPGGQTLPLGEQHIFGAVPKHCITTGWTAILDHSANDIVVSVGFTGNPTFWLDNVTLSNGGTIVNDRTQPMQDYFPEGSDIVVTVHSGDMGESGRFRFQLDQTELETKVGKYTA